MNQNPAALTNCQSFLQEDSGVLEKGEVLKRTALDARGPFPHSGDKKARDRPQTVLQHIIHSGEVTALHFHGAL